uniref:Uncharacterized protein n=1 Tax=Arundo donax TaxID=35708 RepID=A0A0A8ZCH1_ARUDO
MLITLKKKKEQTQILHSMQKPIYISNSLVILYHAIDTFYKTLNVA